MTSGARGDPPRQAVILAGGRGERLRPLTDTAPKPMIRFHGKPFLEYILLRLKEQGFEKVLLLLGYLPHAVENYFGDGSRFGLQIEYSTTDAGNDTGMRLKLAEKSLDPIFLLMYCDNFWPLDIGKLWRQFAASDADAQITVYANEDGYTKNNLRLDAGKKKVICYDKTKSAPDLAGVDIGFVIMKKSVVAEFPLTNDNFEKVMFPKLVERGTLGAYWTGHRYYSVGSHERLPLTEKFLKFEPAVILDRDGVLNVRQGKGEYVATPSQFVWLPGAREAVAQLKKAGHRVMIITNQAGIARGVMTEKDLEDIHAKLRGDLKAAGTAVDAIYYCPHGWDAGCVCRKPLPGMLFKAQRDFHLDLSRTYFVGDDERDAEAGAAAGTPMLMVEPEWPLIRIVEEKILKRAARI